MMIRLFFSFFILLLLSLTSCKPSNPQLSALSPQEIQSVLKKILIQAHVPQHSYKVVKKYTHDNQAYTEGLVYHNGFLYESTGLYYQSTLRKVELTTGKILQQYKLPANYFAEGLTLLDDYFYQLTYKTTTAFKYTSNTLKLIKTIHSLSGWGLTTDGKQLIMSNGTSELLFINKNSFNVTNTLSVNIQNQPINFLNELEYVNGKIYANVWLTNIILILSATDAKVEGWIDISALNPYAEPSLIEYTANGIAYNDKDKTLLVTGKYWPALYAIKVE